MASNLPDYVASAKPLPTTARVPWYKSTAQTYAGIMLWFVFWQQVPSGSSTAPGGFLAHGLGTAILTLVAAALICHFLFYLVPGMLGMKTGLPLYIVGTSTYGVQGGFLMPGFLMGVLQFGWLAVNAYFSGKLLVIPFGYVEGSGIHLVVAAIWAVLGAFMGLKGIKYVARVATFLPLIPFVILIVLCVATIGGLGKFDANALVTSGQAAGAGSPLSTFAIFALMISYVVGFFATAGAAGVDIAMNNRDGKDVQLGGIFGVGISTIFAGGLALLIVAGAYGMNLTGVKGLNPAEMMEAIMGTNVGRVFMYLLVIAAFPAACFSAFIAANSFKTTLPKVNPLISCGIGTAVAIALAVSGWAGKAAENVFPVIGASFGPVCGAMMADYLLAGRKWPGPRAGFNLAGWISWLLGLAVGAVEFIAKIPGLEGLAGKVPCPPVAAFIVGFVLYIILAAIGLQSKKLDMPANA